MVNSESYQWTWYNIYRHVIFYNTYVWCVVSARTARKHIQRLRVDQYRAMPIDRLWLHNQTCCTKLWRMLFAVYKHSLVPKRNSLYSSDKLHIQLYLNKHAFRLFWVTTINGGSPKQCSGETNINSCDIRTCKISGKRLIWLHFMDVQHLLQITESAIHWLD